MFIKILQWRHEAQKVNSFHDPVGCHLCASCLQHLCLLATENQMDKAEQIQKSSVELQTQGHARVNVKLPLLNPNTIAYCLLQGIAKDADKIHINQP